VVGPFLFGATEKLESAVGHAGELPPVVILRLRYMPAIDATGLKAIRDLAESLHASGRTLLLCGAPSQPSRLMEQADFHRHLGEANILPSLSAALQRAEQLIASRVTPGEKLTAEPQRR
jgi:SulP family sulfate permease